MAHWSIILYSFKSTWRFGEWSILNKLLVCDDHTHLWVQLRALRFTIIAYNASVGAFFVCAISFWYSLCWLVLKKSSKCYILDIAWPLFYMRNNSWNLGLLWSTKSIQLQKYRVIWRMVTHGHYLFVSEWKSTWINLLQMEMFGNPIRRLLLIFLIFRTIVSLACLIHQIPFSYKITERFGEWYIHG